MTVTYQGAPVADAAARLMFKDGALSTRPILRPGPIARALAYAHELDRTYAEWPDDETVSAIEDLWHLDLGRGDTLAEALANGVNAAEQHCVDANPSGVWLPTWNDPGAASLYGWLSDLIDAYEVDIAETWEREARKRMALVQPAMLQAAE